MGERYPCDRHDDVLRRIERNEKFRDDQVDENAKIWCELNRTREEKNGDSVTLHGLTATVNDIKLDMKEGFKDLKKEMREQMQLEFTSMKLDIDAIKSLPGKRWNTVVVIIITSTITTVIGGIGLLIFK